MLISIILGLQEVPGRLWDGKEVILEALGELIVVAPRCIQPEEEVITALLGMPSVKVLMDMSRTQGKETGA